MKTLKTPLAIDAIELVAEEDRHERELALEYVAEAWNVAEDDGVPTAALAHASLFAALTSMVEQHGDMLVAELIATLPDRIRSGEYNLTRSLQ